MSIEALTPSIALYNRVKAGFIVAGTSLTAWGREHGVNASNARHCLVGSWNGPKAKDLRARIIKASGIRIPSSPGHENHSIPDQVEATEAEEFFYWGC